MVKIYPNKAPSLISTIDKSEVMAVLLYGPDSGKVSNLLKEISSKITPNLDDPFMVANISSDSLGDESTSIYDEMMAISFGGGKRLVTIKNIDGAEQAKAAVKAIEQLPDNINETSFLLLTAGDLKPTSSLRKLFEGKAKHLVAIPCYKEDARDLSATIFNLVKAKGLYIEVEAASYLADCCQGDSKIIENEIEKLMLYLGDDASKISYEDVVLVTGNTTEGQLQDVCDAVFSSNRANIEVAYKKAVDSGLVPIAIFRVLQRYIEKLHLAYYYVKDGNSIDMAVKYIKPPIFYKQVPVFKVQLTKLLNADESKIFQKYGHILQAEFAIKQSGAEPELIASRVLQKIAS